MVGVQARGSAWDETLNGKTRNEVSLTVHKTTKSTARAERDVVKPLKCKLWPVKNSVRRFLSAVRRKVYADAGA